MFVWARSPSRTRRCRASSSPRCACRRQGRDLARQRLRPRRRRLRPLRARRERAAHPPSHPPAPQRPHQTRLTPTPDRTCVLWCCASTGTRTQVAVVSHPARDTSGHVTRGGSQTRGDLRRRSTESSRSMTPGRRAVARADRTGARCANGSVFTRACSACRARRPPGAAISCAACSRPRRTGRGLASCGGCAVRACRADEPTGRDHVPAMEAHAASRVSSCTRAPGFDELDVTERRRHSCRRRPNGWCSISPDCVRIRTTSRRVIQAARRKRLITYESTLATFDRLARRGVPGVRATARALERWDPDVAPTAQRHGDVAPPDPARARVARARHAVRGPATSTATSSRRPTRALAAVEDHDRVPVQAGTLRRVPAR